MYIDGISASAIEEANRLRIRLRFNFREDTIEEILERMVRFSSPITHLEGNRRFEDYVFNVQNGELIAVSEYRI